MVILGGHSHMSKFSTFTLCFRVQKWSEHNLVDVAINSGNNATISCKKLVNVDQVTSEFKRV